jgi:hypothetical protein
VSHPLTLLESADFTGRCRYVELALFAALGGIVTRCELPTTANFLAGAARAHGFRARLLEEQLPVSLGLPGIEESTRSPQQGFDAAVTALVAPGPDGALRAALLEVVYPAMLAGYEDRLAHAAVAADAPLLRTLRRVVGDLDATRREGLLLGDEVGDDRSNEVAARLKEAGGAFGPIRRAR